jgi:hypothetical protein
MELLKCKELFRKSCDITNKLFIIIHADKMSWYEMIMALKNTLVESKQSQPRSQGPNPISYFPRYCSKFDGRLIS